MAEENNEVLVTQKFFRKIEEAETNLRFAKESLSEAKDLNIDWASMYEEKLNKAYDLVKEIFNHVGIKGE